LQILCCQKVDENGNYTSRFVSWVDPPKVDLKTRVGKQDEEIEELKERLAKYKKENKRLKSKLASKEKKDVFMEESDSE
jgi:predicted RNase H-like nuclease (RuvC/YqgF family)